MKKLKVYCTNSADFSIMLKIGSPITKSDHYIMVTSIDNSTHLIPFFNVVRIQIIEINDGDE